MVTSSPSSLAETSVTSSTARSNASALACDGLLKPLILRTYWRAASRISSSVAGGYALALKETKEPIDLPGFFHFAFGTAESPEQVRAFRERLERDGVPVAEMWEEPDYVSVKCRDPDGYVVELAWEPD